MVKGESTVLRNLKKTLKPTDTIYCTYIVRIEEEKECGEERQHMYLADNAEILTSPVF